MLGRGAGDHGESACKVGVEDGFQREARKVAGGPRAAVSFWSSSLAMFCDELMRTEGINGCVRLRGIEEEQEEVAGSPAGVGTVNARRRNMRASNEESERPSGAIRSREKGEKERRTRGLNRAGIDGQLGRGDGAGVTPATLLEREEKPSEKNEPTGGSHLSSVEEKGEGNGSVLTRWAAGCLFFLGRIGFPGYIYIYFLLLFSFSVSLFSLYLLHTLSKQGQTNF
jgi:hypothetical protein